MWLESRNSVFATNKVSPVPTHRTTCFPWESQNMASLWGSRRTLGRPPFWAWSASHERVTSIFESIAGIADDLEWMWLVCYFCSLSSSNWKVFLFQRTRESIIQWRGSHYEVGGEKDQAGLEFWSERENCNEKKGMWGGDERWVSSERRRANVRYGRIFIQSGSSSNSICTQILKLHL